MTDERSLWLIMGCTAGGKGKLALELARRWSGRILSVDSMKVYRRMDIGTAKPSAADRDVVPHYLVDVVEPSESFSMGRYIELADSAIEDIRRAGAPVIAVGGTAMYIRALLEGIFDGPAADVAIRSRLKDRADRDGTASLHAELSRIDPAGAERIHPNDLKRLVRALEIYELTGRTISSFQQQFRSGRLRYPWRLIGLRRAKDDCNSRINSRVKRMMEIGLLDEVSALLAAPAGLSVQAAQAVGYAELIAHLKGDCDLDDAVEKIKINTRRFAKNQRTWFRSFAGVSWFDLSPDETAEQLADRIDRSQGQ